MRIESSVWELLLSAIVQASSWLDCWVLSWRLRSAIGKLCMEGIGVGVYEYHTVDRSQVERSFDTAATERSHHSQGAILVCAI